MRYLIGMLLWGLFFTVQGQPNGPLPGSLYLGMDIREFSAVLPDYAPRTLAFTGHLRRDSLWCGTQWDMDFSFARGTLVGGTLRTDSLGTDSLDQVKTALHETLNGLYGSPIGVLGTDSTAPPVAYLWQVKTSQLRLSEHPRARLLLELTSLTRAAPGELTLDLPIFFGMPIETFAVFHPQFVRQGIGYQGVITRPDKFGDMPGTWQYWFRHGTLQEMFFRANWVLGPEDDPDNWTYVGDYTHELIEKLKEAWGPATEHLQSEAGEAPLVRQQFIHRESARWSREDRPGQRYQVEVLFGQHTPATGYGYFFRYGYQPDEDVHHK